jgi:UDP-N-acetylmuramate dehydrogenase
MPSSLPLPDHFAVAPPLDDWVDELRTVVRGEVRQHESMAAHTTFRVGGPADLFLLPCDEEDLLQALTMLHRHRIPIHLLGNGSNLLVADGGIRGAVIRLTPNFAHITREGTSLDVGAGAKLARIVHFAAAEELAGLESTMGIPGTLGGAIVMNAGTDVGSISDLVAEATFVTHAGTRLVKTGDDLSYGYRQSALQGSDLIVLSTRLQLSAGTREAILAKMTRLEEKRTSRQPTRCRTAGSTFKNIPLPDGGRIAAGKLIDHADGKGHRIGGAEVSDKHANFIVAHPGATAADIRRLANWMHQRVLDVHDHDLHPEIELVGDWREWDEPESITW